VPARRIQLEVGDVIATAELLEDVAPMAVQALWQSLPIETTLVQSKWSGPACYFQVPPGPLAEVEALEAPVCSIYPGTLVLSPQAGELLIAYGASEYRRHVGTDYVSRLARLRENRAAFLDAIGQIKDVGARRLSIRRAKPSSAVRDPR